MHAGLSPSPFPVCVHGVVCRTTLYSFFNFYSLNQINPAIRGYYSSDLARYCRLNERKLGVRWVVGALHRGLSPSKRTQNKKCRTLFRLRRHERIACSAVFTLCTSCTMHSTYTRYRMYHCALCCFGESRVACRELCVVCRVSCFACPVSCVCVLVFGVVCALCVLGLCCRVLLWLRPPPRQGLFAGGPSPPHDFVCESHFSRASLSIPTWAHCIRINSVMFDTPP